MKQFFEQYGGVALGILALLVLIAMITPVGNIIKTSLQGTVQTFSTKMDGQVDTMTESMNAAFTNATGFTGVKDHTYYFNGQVHPFFEEYGMILSDDGRTAVDKNGQQYTLIKADVNAVINENSYRSNGVAGFLFDIYQNGTLLYENAIDATIPISVNNNDEFKIVIKNVPDGYHVKQTEYIYHTYDIEKVALGSPTSFNYVLYIYIYTN